MPPSQRRRTQLSFARSVAKAETLSELNLLRQVYRLELGRQSPEREVLDLLAKSVEGHLQVRALAEGSDTPPAGAAAPTVQRSPNGIQRSPDCCGCPSFPHALCPQCAHFNGFRT